MAQAALGLRAHPGGATMAGIAGPATRSTVRLGRRVEWSRSGHGVAARGLLPSRRRLDELGGDHSPPPASGREARDVIAGLALTGR